jgi:hypothetical protein
MKNRRWFVNMSIGLFKGWCSHYLEREVQGYVKAVSRNVGVCI